MARETCIEDTHGWSIIIVFALEERGFDTGDSGVGEGGLAPTGDKLAKPGGTTEDCSPWTMILGLKM